MKNKLFWVLVVLVMLCVNNIGTYARPIVPFIVKEYPSKIPPHFEDLCQENQRVIENLKKSLSKLPNIPGQKQLSTEIPHSNSNRGPRLLGAQNWQETIQYLDQLNLMGFTAITLDVHFPLLYRPFHQSNREFEAYLNYYKNLVQAIRDREMSVLIESQTIFTQAEFSTLPVQEYYQSLSLEEYQQGRLDTLITIAKELKPDYLSVASEPVTEAELSGKAIGEYKDYLNFIEFLLQGMATNRSNFKLGAGFGTWEKEYLQFTKDYSQKLPLDFINIHVYPLVGGQAANLLQISKSCKLSQKEIVIGEAWLYKARSSELNHSSDIATSSKIFSRDSYSFFEPLDRQFIDLMVYYSQKFPVSVLNLFWSHYFFAYLAYEQHPDASYIELSKALNLEVFQNYHQQTISSLGCHVYCLLNPEDNALPILRLQPESLPYQMKEHEMDTFRSLTEGSISLWFRFEKQGMNQSIMPIFFAGSSEEHPQNLIILEVGHNRQSNQKLYFTVVKDNVIPLCFDSRINLQPEEWYHFVVTVGNKGNTGYLNGIEMVDRHYNFGDSSQQNFFSQIPINHAFLGYGSTKYPISPRFENFPGQIKNFMIFDHALDQNEVAVLYSEF